MQTIRHATKEDVPIIQELVSQAGLNTKGIAENVDNFLIMEEQSIEKVDKDLSVPIAVVGFELQAKVGLMRSFVLKEKSVHFNIIEIMRAVIDFSKQRNLEKLYLCTKQASTIKLFRMLGFQIAKQTPSDIKTFVHFQNITKEDPTIMYFSFS